MLRNALQCLWVRAESDGSSLLAGVLFRLLIKGREGPVLLSEVQIATLQAAEARARAARLKALSAESLEALEAGKLDIISIGIFACNRFDLLKETVATFSAYLEQYGHTFPHEVLFFHDGANAEIEAWAKEQKLFDRVLMNPVNHGLSKNINRFWFEESRGKYLINIEDDWRCEFQDNFLLHALEVLKADPAIGCFKMERWFPEDYRTRDTAHKIDARVFSERIYETSSGFSYRLTEKGSYANACVLFRYSSLALAGKLRDDAHHRRSQEGEYMRVYNPLWEGARGIAFKDSPFLHLGLGHSVPSWKN